MPSDAGDWRPGDVIRVWDRQTRPPKFKWHICIDLGDQRFLRINTRAVFRPHFLLRKSVANFLEHDSYVELRGFVRPFRSEIDDAEFLGTLSSEARTALCSAVEHVETLTPDDKALIRERLLDI